MPCEEQGISPRDSMEASLTEEAPLLAERDHNNGSNGHSRTKLSSSSSPAGLISLLLIGVFIANADGSLVLATNSTVASSFSSLHLATWLTTSYMMSMCCAQPIVGKLSEIYSRKSVLLSCYAIFAAGCALCGLGWSMSMVIAGRAVGGIGGAGMTVVVSILITDLVEVRDIASWRSYVNIFATTGRMVGGPLGGWLADVVGWRWSFLGQVPIITIAILLVSWRLDARVGRKDLNDGDKTASRFAQIDFLGTLLLSGSIVTFLLAIDILGQSTDITSHLKMLVALLVTSTLLIIMFGTYENKHDSPVFPPSLLLHRSVWTAYLSVAFQSAAQLSLMFSVPLYFQVVSNVSNTSAGAHLMPAFFANTIGALFAGYYIKRSGRYKSLTLFGTLIGAAAYVTVILRWHAGGVNLWESLEIAPGGFSTALVMASSFIVLTAGLPHESVAVATGGYYLVSNLGTVVGIGISSGLQRAVLHVLLGKRLHGEAGKTIIKKIIQNVGYVQKLKGDCRDIVVQAYVESLAFSHGYSLTLSLLAFGVALCIREHRLE